jgi:uncharacterized protein (TIGR02646 family)
MINLVKSQPAPTCLAEEKLKKYGTYRCKGVIEQIHIDFKDKCYICEATNLTSINVEHFQPHKGNKDKKFEWENLFYVCGHCNNTKLAKAAYEGMLNCTNPAHKVADWIRYAYDDSNFPDLKVILEEVVAKDGVSSTIKLLEDVFNGEQTPIKKIECRNLRNLLHDQLADLNNHLAGFYLNGNLSQGELEAVKIKIKEHLQKESPFSAFKIWVIRSKESYMRDFGQFIP